MAKLYVALSHFHPALLQTSPPGAETYTHDERATYLVAQPFIFISPDHPDRISVADYFAHWDAAAIDVNGVVLIDAVIGEQLQLGKITALPVPLPPGVSLRLHLQGATVDGVPVDWDEPRVLSAGSTTWPVADEYLLDGSAGGWPGFAVLSSAQPQVTAYADLDGGAGHGPQKTAVLRAMLGNFSALVQAYDNGTPPPGDARGQLWLHLVKPHYGAHPLDADPAWWQSFLDQPHASGATNIGWAYALLISEQNTLAQHGKPYMSAPRYHWSDSALQARGDLFLKSGGTLLKARSYIDALWTTLRDVSAGDPDAATAMLGRLFGFGERLAWPLARLQGPLADTRRFMALRTSLAHVTGVQAPIDPALWFATNAVSLLGLVFRITPFDPADPPARLDTADFFVGVAQIADAAALAQSINTYLLALAADLAGPPVSVDAVWAGETGRQSPPSTLPNRFVMFAPREAPLQQLAAPSVPAGRLVYTVPEALLDIVDDLPRAGVDGRGQLARPGAPRRGFFAAELLRYGALTMTGNRYAYRLAVTLTRRPLAGLAGNAFAVTMRSPAHPAESMLEQWLADLPAGVHRASLWIAQEGPPPFTVDFALSPALLARDIDGVLLIADPHPSAGSLTELVELDPPSSGATGNRARQPFLVFECDPSHGDPFDLIEFAAAPSKDTIALAVAPVTRLSMSADRIAHSLALTWNPGFEANGARLDGTPTPKVDHAADANKLRLRMAGPAGLIRALAEPDALLPLPHSPRQFDPRPWNRFNPAMLAAAHAGYWLAEHFDHDRYDGPASEDTRFGAWVRAGEAVTLSGYVEHQLGHRVPLRHPLAPDLRRGVDIALPTDVHAGETVPEALGQPQTGVLLPLVVVREDGATLRVALDTCPAKLALTLFKSADPARGAEGDPVVGLRAIYRAIAELRDAAADGVAEVVIEAWRFDNTALVGSATGRGTGEGLTLAAGLVPDHSATIALTTAGAHPQLIRLFNALEGDFAFFVKELQQAVDAAVGGELALLAATPTAPFSVAGSYVRAGLRLVRPARVRAPASWANGAFIPVVDLDSDPRAGQALANQARAELAAHLSDPESRAVSGLGWANPLPPADQAIAGASGGQLLRPSSGTDVVERVLDLFYMPHAFALPGTHAAVGDRQATMDFAGFLLTLMDDILAGRDVGKRIALFPASDAAGAVGLRAALRDLLERTDGVADALMALLVRVDVAAPAATTIEQKLHWHAGRLLDELETIVPADQRPRSAIRRMLAAEPALFQCTRAIAISPFNTKVATSGADPAAAVNHSTFSTQLYDFTINKTLVADGGARQSDATRFSATDLRGGTANNTMYTYVLDVLPDPRYDDTIEIVSTTFHGVDPKDASQFGLPRRHNEVETSGDAQAQRGETVVDPKSGNGISINVVHVFPQWRRRDATRLVYPYVLPERRMPARPRPVDVCLAGQPGKRAAHSEISPDITGNMPTIDLQAQWDGRPGHPGAYARAIASLARVDIASAKKDASRREFVRIAPASTGTDPSVINLPQVHSSRREHIDGWHTLTAELSHFWFEMALDKRDETLVDNLDDNAYEVEVEMWSGVPPASAGVAEDDVAADDQDVLLRAFRHWRDGRPAPQIDPATLPTLLERWLVSAPASMPWQAQTLLEKSPQARAQTDADRPAWSRKFRIARDEGDGWKISELDGLLQHGMGAVVGFEILARPHTDGSARRYDERVVLEDLSALIRISVLDHPFHVSRARLRTLRNWRSLDGDEVPDINPDLLLAQRYTDWVSELRQPMVLGSHTPNWDAVPPTSRELRVVPPGGDQQTRIREWLTKTSNATATIDFGFALERCLSEPAFIDSSSGGKVHTLWPIEWMRSEGFSLHPVIRRTLPDLSFRYGDGATVTLIAERQVDAPRQVLTPAPATELATILDQISPSQVVSLEHESELVWRDQESVEVLRVQLPVVFKR